MATRATIQNGVKAKNGRRKRTSTKRRRRNPVTAAAKTRRRNGTTRAGALSFAKKNGMKLVSATSNPKRKHHRRKKRNGIAVTSRARNGFFGDTRGDVATVGSIVVGMGATKLLGRIVGNLAGGVLSSVGAGGYTEVISDAAVAFVAIPMAAKMLGQQKYAKNARTGGLIVVALGLVDKFMPSALDSINPFKSDTSPVVMTQNGAALTPSAVAAIAAGVAGSANPAQAASKVGSAMAALNSGTGLGNGISDNAYVGGGSPMLAI